MLASPNTNSGESFIPGGSKGNEGSNLGNERLRKLNRIATVLHGTQFIFMVAACAAVKNFRDFKLPLTYNYLTLNNATGGLQSTTELIGNIQVGPLVSIFFLLSALFQGLTTVGSFNETYTSDLDKGINRFRWYEYAISSSVMIWIIAMFVGVSDLASLFMLFTCNATMNLFGLLMETHNTGKEAGEMTWLPFWFGCFAGFAPWVTVFVGLIASSRSDPGPPSFVYGIFATYFVMFQTFPINMALQYKKVRKWADYRYGELVYIFLSLIAKSLLGWLVFGGLQQPNNFTSGP